VFLPIALPDEILEEMRIARSLFISATKVAGPTTLNGATFSCP